jgi:hypothetical protein
MTIEYHEKAMAMAIHIEGLPQMLNEISCVVSRAKSENRVRPRKGF